MSLKHVLLINPTITKRRSARFPLAVLNLSASLDGRYTSSIIDGNIDRDFVSSALRAVDRQGVDAVGVSVMGGPQLSSAIAVSRALKERHPATPIIWGGHFPTICAAPALAMPYVDYAVRGQGEQTLAALLDALFRGEQGSLGTIDGLSWRSSAGIVHNPNRAFSAVGAGRALPYERLGDPRAYLAKTYLGQRTAGYQAALGCRFRCTFCGVAAMFRGKTALPPVERVERDLRLFTRMGVDSLLLFDHNFFDREDEMVPLLELLARFRLPWWCFARSDALLNLSERSWSLVRQSRLRMAYIGAESPSDLLLHDIRKGTRSEQTLEVVARCHSEGVIPELSFMLAPPQDPQGETERTFDYIRHIKRLHPLTEIMIYLYAPLPPPPVGASPHVERAVSTLKDASGAPLVFPVTAQEWAQEHWIRYWCHTDTPWLTERLRQRIRDFTTVLGCKFPTVTDIRSPSWGKSTLRALASWRYRSRCYERPWELDLFRKLIRLWDPRVSSL